MSRFRGNRAAAKRQALENAGNRCSFPGCGLELVDGTGVPFGEFCHIKPYSLESSKADATGEDERHKYASDILIENIIVLCPEHHRLVDLHAERYTTDWLKTAKRNHEANVGTKRLEQLDVPSLTQRLTAFHDALDTWRSNSGNGDEEFWHQTLKNDPSIIAQAMPNCAIQIADKSYVGGKGLSNTGGKIVDFVYTTKKTKNVVVVEIKTPATKLIGAEYRTDIFSVTEDLSGAIVQVLTYRNHLIKNFHALKNADPSADFEVFDPQCMVIAGNLEVEKLTAAQRASFDLFRANCAVTIITYDEMYAKIEDIVEMIDKKIPVQFSR